MKIVAILVVALTLGPALQRARRDTNSHAASARGAKQFATKKYREAVTSFGKANAIAPTPSRAFNHGIAEVAAGEREVGSSTLEKAMADPRLRPDALFNRGNSALAAKAYDYAIRDYIDTLKLRPGHSAAKRNLEIALRQQASQRQGGGSGKNPNQQPQQNPQAKPQSGKNQQPSDPNLEALLRSVQQQEQEELSRMHKPQPDKLHVGW